MTRSLFAILLFAFFSRLGAQSYPTEVLYRHQLTLTIGAHHGYVKDQNFSPLNYKSSGLRFGLGYGRATRAGHLVSAELGLGLTKLKSRLSKYNTTDRYLIDLSFGYLRAIGAPEGNRQIRLGGKYRSYVDISIFEGAEAISFFALHGFEVAGDAAWRTGDRHRLKVAGSLPVLGLLVRPPYTGWDKFISDNDAALLRILTRGKWTSLNEFTGLRASIGWVYSLNDRWIMETGYDFSYYSTRRLDPVRILNNQFSVTATRKY